MTTTTAHEPVRQPPHRVPRELLGRSGFLLARLGFGFKTKAMKRLERAGFELHDYSVLAILAEGAQETQSTIADVLTVDPSRLVALLDSLEERSLITRQRDPQDRRRHVVTITPAGRRELARIRQLVEQVEKEVLAPLDADERATLHALLLRLAAANDPRCTSGGVAPDDSGAAAHASIRSRG